MARVEPGADGVTVRLSPLDEVSALHGWLRIPHAHIRSVSTDAVPLAWYRGIKMGATVAGTFGTGEGATLQCLRAPRAGVLGSGDATAPAA
jgi:hypothetical protein